MPSPNHDSDPSASEFNRILREIGIGAAIIDYSGKITYRNELFRLLLERSPTSYRGIELEAKATRKAADRIAFEPEIGWLYWTAVPVSEGLSIRFSTATPKQISRDRDIKKFGLDPHSGLPNRLSLIAELGIAIMGERIIATMLLEPAASPEILGLDNLKTDEIVKRIGTVLEGQLGPHERLFRLSPLTLALTFPTTPGLEEDRALTLLRMVERQAYRTGDSKEPIQFLGGIATSGATKNPQTIVEYARRALLRARATGVVLSWEYMGKSDS